MNYFSSDFKLGILGGGQLGKMLLFDTRKFDIQTYVLDPSDEAPCKIACDQFFKGDLMDFETVYNFGKKVDVLTFEIELVNLDALVKLEDEGLKVYPSPKTLKLIQNKGIQKDFYTQHTIPTANYKRFDNLKSLIVDILDSKTKLPFVWKCTEFGYDGNGVKVIRQISDLDNLANVECIAEEMVPFKNELAVIVCRNPSGEIRTYPVVEMEFHPEANQVEYVICPARIDDAVAEKARAIALNISKEFNHVGLLAVEMFQTEDDEIIVNEVAPRPHNSGHYSIEASYTSQFENHLRAILDLPLGNTESKVAGIMVNLVGEEGFSGNVLYENIEKILRWTGVTPHIYGKKQTRPFRKMGHVTIVNEDINEARRIAENVKNTIRVISGQ
ncbi:MAG: 5-(carboxyamino)imidazole ribonucleotide synthase [Flavobacterium sp.]|jgi:5-(carboxyamino)imidazole ribonucleotide synthase|uniref:5-(carboxyamino)imidazole ribonucleotide synthase n=1 Tax=Flavobacterium sp. TaxID=239 RepID=UPI001B4FAC0F|nr:5-(carboxyamino)imidazole ribonucleotide synthase [Flavobacterium sp.]MBP6146979.1 5-(carboxyamino)imidazole ribonucleotide synthase [Flavobacterium sp.]MBP7182803.1 5-(carboxyamino)imidazole ribonucleotide synthase [Flavobacterium sp.]MBP7318688.1 5-(carboxyamino)imidazole ribonucleotide synthase [Flavobacterium sp.]MBP8887184.1 5-(carboxyamino)imidazole ribonucleotide synthase [Flavobacterium sp.]HRL71712.1 5-(carboxyamino)imidazole ribonucleotide synthase [Flavobacterium sp.]